jgi:hypothetical protein
VLGFFRKIIILFCSWLAFDLEAQVDTFISNVFKEKYTIHKININSNDYDFSPFIANKKLYFVSSRRENVGVVFTNHDTLMHYTDVYVANQIDSITFSTPSNMPAVTSNCCLENPKFTLYFKLSTLLVV